jgi:hypothetical protein
MTRATAILLLAAATGCYGTPRSRSPDADSSSAGRGGTSGQAGTGGGSGTGLAGTGGGGTAGSGPVFVGGPCVVLTNATSLEVFARGSDGAIYRRPSDGNNWSTWAPLVGLGEAIDVRSDVDCSASGTTVHIVATGLNPIGAILHAFGVGNAYNRFRRELDGSVFDPSPSITGADDANYRIGAVAFTWPALHQFGDLYTPQELTPITTQTGSFRSGPDIAMQPAGGSSVTYFVTLDDTGALAIYYWVINSGGFYWADPVKLPAPTGAFTFSPTICTENGGFGISSVNIAAVAGGKLWYARTDSITSPFSPWNQISEDVASSPDCAIGGRESIAHVVALSSAGTVLDVHGKGTSWVTTDLGSPR